MALEPWRERNFPNLSQTDYQVTSDETPDYNCMAWAVGDPSRWWWPSPFYYWPTEAPQEATLESFKAVFAIMGYAECSNAEPEPGFEKVAIYADHDGSPTHAARQIEPGSWSSKLGRLHDIEHSTLSCLEGQAYGAVAVILRRPRSAESA